MIDGHGKNLPCPDFLLNMQTVIVKNIRFRLFLTASGVAKSAVFLLAFMKKEKAERDPCGRAV